MVAVLGYVFIHDVGLEQFGRDADAGVAFCKQVELPMMHIPNGQVDMFNPADLFLASLAACILKNLKRLALDAA